MKLAYWILVALLGALYLFAGASKLTRSPEQLKPTMQWVEDPVPMWGVRAIGAIEIIGVAGLVLPPLIGVAPVLAVVAAICFVVFQVFAIGVHLSKGEGIAGIPINLVLIVMAAVIAWLGTAF